MQSWMQGTWSFECWILLGVELMNPVEGYHTQAPRHLEDLESRAPNME